MGKLTNYLFYHHSVLRLLLCFWPNEYITVIFIFYDVGEVLTRSVKEFFLIFTLMTYLLVNLRTRRVGLFIFDTNVFLDTYLQVLTKYVLSIFGLSWEDRKFPTHQFVWQYIGIAPYNDSLFFFVWQVCTLLNLLRIPLIWLSFFS